MFIRTIAIGVSIILPHLLVANHISAEELIPEIIVSSSYKETKPSQTASNVEVITSTQIEQSGHLQLIDLLRSIPSIDLVQSGSLGGNVSIFIRGANSEHTLVLIDGVEVNNPASTSRAFNFSNINTKNIERIEILKGPQASIYGSDAIGGVINIISKKNDNESTVNFLAGSFDTTNFSTNVSRANQQSYFNAHASVLKSNSISQSRDLINESENDSYQNFELSSNFGHALSNKLKVDFNLRYNETTSDIDDFAGDFGEDPNRELQNKLYLFGSKLTYLATENFETNLITSYQRQILDDRDQPDFLHPIDFLDSNFRGNLFRTDLRNILKVTDENNIIFGYSFEEEGALNESLSISDFGEFADSLDKHSNTSGYYAEHLFTYKQFSNSAVIRLDDHSQFGSKINYRVGPSLYFSESKIKLSSTYGTAFKAPSLYQLYSQYGLADLKPESSEGLDLSIEKEFEKVKLGVSAYDQKIRNLIDFDSSSFIFENISEARTKGIESYLEYQLSEQVGLTFKYAYLNPKNLTTSSRLLRRARQKASAQLNWKFNEKLNLWSEAVLTGNRTDQNFSTFPAEKVELGSYLLLNFNSTYLLTDHTSLTFKIDNLLDKEYVEIFGYNTRGIGAYLGINHSF